MPKYITNRDDTLKEAMSQIPSATQIDILVGYVYFSGLKSIMDEPKRRREFFEKPVRILVGMHIDAQMTKEYHYYAKPPNISVSEQRKLSQVELQTMLNQEEFDDKDLLKLFIEKIQNNTLEIRQTKDPAHAKIYIFQMCDDHTQDSFHKGIVITGSSNLTYSGLGGQTEFNVVLEDTEAFDKAKQVFEELWATSINILDKKELQTFIQKVGLLTEPTPYEVFHKVLCEYFEYATPDDTKELAIMPSSNSRKNKYLDLAYQIDAVKDAISKIRSHNGVIIADVVGLGKSIIAACVAKNLELYGDIDKVLIIAPPNLKDSWKNYARDFNINCEICSAGKLDDFLTLTDNNVNRKYLIIVDEVHRFRNKETKLYSDLYKICWGQKVMLLSATPINNTSADIFTLLELFQDFTKASICNYENINRIVTDILKKEKELRKSEPMDKDKLHSLSKQILELIHPVLIRRTRKDLIGQTLYRKDLERQKIELNKVRDPETHEYKLKGDLAILYAETLEKISPQNDQEINENNKHFLGVRYKALAYLLPDKAEKVLQEIDGEDTTRTLQFIQDSSQNMSKFMRRLLVRRFESSVHAFKCSINNIINSYNNIQSWLEYDYLPIYKKGSLNIDEVLTDSDLFNHEFVDEEEGRVFDKTELSKYKEKGLVIIKSVKSKLSPSFFDEFKNDLKVLSDIQKKWEKNTKDPKFDYIYEQVKKMLEKDPTKKIIIFSEFADTVNYLQQKFSQKTEQAPLKSISFIASDGQEKKQRIIVNFDASIPFKESQNDFDILIATDTLSEGVNLHKAGIVINYDIPYNPTRVIQRIGRINRIGKKSFSELEIHNYIPRLEVQKEATNWTISKYKISLINAILGSDTKTLTKEEDIEAVFSLRSAEALLIDSDEESWDTKYKEIYDELTEDIDLYTKIKALPPRLELAKNSEHTGIVEVSRVGSIITSRIYNSKTKERTHELEQAFSLLKCMDKDEKYIETTENLKTLKKEVRKINVSSDNTKTPDVIIRLRKELPSIRDNISESNYEYLQLLIEIGSRLPKYDTRFLQEEKVYECTDGKIEKIQERISLNFLKRLKYNIKSTDLTRPQLLITEELNTFTPE